MNMVGASPGVPGLARDAVRRRLWRVWQLGQTGVIIALAIVWGGPSRWHQLGWVLMLGAAGSGAVVNLFVVARSKLEAKDKRRLALEALTMAAFSAAAASVLLWVGSNVR